MTLPENKTEQPNGCSDGVFRIPKRFNRKLDTRRNILTPLHRLPAFPVSQWHIGVAPRYSCRYSPWITHGSFILMLLFTFTGDSSMYPKHITRRRQIQRPFPKNAPPERPLDSAAPKEIE